MAVFLSPVGGVAAQFFTNTGAVLTGGKLYTYAAGTTTPLATYTSSGGGTAWTNPIVLDAAGRVSGSGEIWLTDGLQYKFVLKDSNDVLIATYDNINGINSDFTNFLSNQEIFTATAGQTVFTLANPYAPGANTLSVFVDGVNQYGPGAQYAYLETSANTVTFVSGLHVGASVKFTTTQSLTSTQATTAALVSYTPGGTGAVITTVQTKLRETVSVTDFGAVGNGTTDDYAAFQAAINALPVSGGTIIIPATTSNSWKISQTLNVRKKVHMIGQIAKGTGEKGTTLVFPANTSGIVFNSYNTSLYQTVASDPLLPGAYGSILENVALYGDKAGSSTAADGVVVRCTMECRGVAVRNFYRYGFRIYADLGAGGSIEGDANQWMLNRCDAIANGDHGVYVNGDDANTGVAIKVFSQLNGGYGIYENSLIGNTYIGCDTVANTLGSMSATRASAANTVIGLWEDDGGKTSQFDGDSNTIIGGNGGNPSASSTSFSMWGGAAQRKPYQYLNTRGSERVSSQLGTNTTDTSMTVQTFGAETSEGSLSAWKFQFDATEKAWFLQYASSAAFTPIAYINSAASLYTLKGFTGPVFRNGYAVRKTGNISTSKVRMLDSAAPTTGTWVVGDIVYNDTPTAGGFIGWVCTTAGTPGTWKTFGAISA
jgi:hypothetical protein